MPRLSSARRLVLLQSRRSCPIQPRSVEQGFTLIELLVSAGVALLLMGAAAGVITAHIRSTATAELAQRVRDDSNRLNYLIQTEASEAASMGQGQTIAGCTPAPGATTSIFNLNVPRPTGTAADSTNISTIWYYASGGDLRRCGPPILRNGTIDHTATPVDSIVSANTVLDATVACQSTTSGPRQIAFRATFNDVPAGYQPDCAIARAKSFIVRDPTDPI
jgi:prepilin-type N-terminal cleavage/methylation domain-containing protein